MAGRDYVLPEDVAAVFPVTVAHRLLLTPEAQTGGAKAAVIARSILQQVAQPPVDRR